MSSTSQFELAKFQMFNRHVWLVATVVNSAILDILFYLRNHRKIQLKHEVPIVFLQGIT